MDAPIHAAACGTVTYAGNELKDYGNLVLIKHAGGYVTAYAHADRLLVSRGDFVAKGQVIGYAGQTGDVSTPQLHFEIRQRHHAGQSARYLARRRRTSRVLAEFAACGRLPTLSLGITLRVTSVQSRLLPQLACQLLNELPGDAAGAAAAAHRPGQRPACATLPASIFSL